MRTRVPYALHEMSQTIVNAHEVTSGANCGCICLSCNLPLVAKQGKVNVWHFAHITTENNQVSNLCRFSLFVTLRRIALQELKKGTLLTDLHLPAHTISARCIAPDGLPIDSTLPVTEASHVSFLCTDSETTLNGVPVDALGTVRNTPLGLIFIHPERTTINEPKVATDHRNGIVVIDLTPLEGIDRHRGNPTEKLMEFLLTNIPSKRWLYHPREPKIQIKLQQALSKRCDDMQRRIEEEKQKREQHARIATRVEQKRLMREKHAIAEAWGTSRNRKATQLFHCTGCGCWFTDTDHDSTMPDCQRCGLQPKVHRVER